MEQLHKGFLTKSPPEHKTQGPLKIFNSKWRKRYFVLYCPPQKSNISDKSCIAELDYYNNNKMDQKMGSINLKQCKSIFNTESIYPYAFTIRTMDRDNTRSRDYCLVAENSDEFKQWMQKLCFVVGIQNETDIQMVKKESFNEKIITIKTSDVYKNLPQTPSSANVNNLTALNQQGLTSDKKDNLPIVNLTGGIALDNNKSLVIKNNPSSALLPKRQAPSKPVGMQNYCTNLELNNTDGTNGGMKMHVYPMHKTLQSIVHPQSYYNNDKIEDSYKKPIKLDNDSSIHENNSNQDPYYKIPCSLNTETNS